MSFDWYAIIERELVGESGVIERRETDWVLHLERGIVVTLMMPWRIVRDGRIAISSVDDGYRVGSTTPLDGQEVANAMLRDQTITRASIDRETADLSLIFGAATSLEAFNHSACYDGWHISLTTGGQAILAMAIGGGDIQVFSQPSTN